MGVGPAYAIPLACQRAGITLKDLDIIEINEAFASQVLGCLALMKIDFNDSRVNPNGGAIAIGHPLGASGARIATTLLHAMRDADATLGLATMCIGLGQGIAVLFERIR